MSSDMSAAPISASVATAEATPALPVASSETQAPVASQHRTFADVASVVTQPVSLPGRPSGAGSHTVHLYSIRSTTGGDLRYLNVFKADRELHQLLGPYTKFDHGRDKSLTITVSHVGQAQRLLQLTSLLGEPVVVEPHPSTRQSIGLVSSSLLPRMSDKDILAGLSDQKVVKVARRAGNTYRLTFCQPTPPPEITLCTGFVVPVRRAYPLPLRCFRCQHYGHSHTTCKSTRVVCARCGQQANANHDPQSCSLPEWCFHCKTAHSASSPTCPRYVAEKRILLLHHRDGISFPDARRQVLTAASRDVPAMHPPQPPQETKFPVAATSGTSQPSLTSLPHQPSAAPTPRPVSSSPVSRKRIPSSPCREDTSKRSRHRQSPPPSPLHATPQPLAPQSPPHTPSKAVDTPLPTSNRFLALQDAQTPEITDRQDPTPPVHSTSRPPSSRTTSSKKPSKAPYSVPTSRSSSRGPPNKGAVKSRTGSRGPSPPCPPSSRRASQSASLSSIPVIHSASPRPDPRAT